MKLYEGMFLLDNRLAKKDEEKALELVTDLIKRFDGEIVDANKWAERKLAYPINKQTRGTYYLTHFNAPPESIRKINHQCKLTSEILRQLIIVDEDGPASELKHIPAGEEKSAVTPEAKSEESAPVESNKGED
jgi:small subunit ribosomal protein S6